MLILQSCVRAQFKCSSSCWLIGQHYVHWTWTSHSHGQSLALGVPDHLCQVTHMARVWLLVCQIICVKFNNAYASKLSVSERQEGSIMSSEVCGCCHIWRCATLWWNINAYIIITVTLMMMMAIIIIIIIKYCLGI